MQWPLASGASCRRAPLRIESLRELEFFPEARRPIINGYLTNIGGWIDPLKTDLGIVVSVQ